MSDSDKDLMPHNLVERRDLWSIQVKPEEDGPWFNYGTDTSDWESVLRTYNFRKEHHPEEPIRMVHTEVLIRVADPDWLTLKLKEEKAAKGEDAAVPSE